MYDGKRSTAERILYDALDKIKSKNNDDPLKIFNTAITNVKPNLECRSRRVGGATYQVPVEVKAKRAQALALRWIMEGMTQSFSTTSFMQKANTALGQVLFFQAMPMPSIIILAWLLIRMAPKKLTLGLYFNAQQKE